MRVIWSLMLLTYCLMVSSNPIEPSINLGSLYFEDFLSHFSPTEQSALTEMVAEASERAILQRSSSGSFTAEVNLTIPDIIRQRFQADSNFKSKLINWIGRQWSLPEESITDLELKGRGCSSRFCLTIQSRNDCCPFG